MGPPLSAYVGEPPKALQRICLGVTAVLTVVLVWLWLASDPAPGGDPLFTFAVFLILFSEWVALGMLLRPRGTGLRRSAGARLLAFGFGLSHLAAGAAEFLHPILSMGRRNVEDSILWSVMLWALGAMIIGAAAQAHWAAAGGPSGTGPGTQGPPNAPSPAGPSRGGRPPRA